MMATGDTKMWLQGRGRGYASELVARTRPYMIQTITQVLSNSLESLHSYYINSKLDEHSTCCFQGVSLFLTSDCFVAGGSGSPPAWELSPWVPDPGGGGRSDWGHSQSAWGLHGQPS